MKHLQELLAIAEASPDKDGIMPISYRTGKGHKIEAYGVKGMQNKQWRKSFKDSEALEKWCDANDATVHGTAKIDEGLNEGKDLDELVDAWMEKNNAWRTEGSRGVDNIEKLIRALGYRNMDGFLEDNPGAIESLFNWIKEQNISEWKEALAEFDSDESLDEGKGGAFGVKLGGISTEKNHFGFEDRLNAQKVASALKDAEIAFTRSSAGGIFYFDFDSAADLKKAVKIAKSVIDKSVESEW